MYEKTRAVPFGAGEKLSTIQCRRMRDKVARALSGLYRRTACCNQSRAGAYIDASFEGWWAPRFGSNNVRPTKDAAVASGVIEENRSYCAGTDPDKREDTFPMSYRLPEPLRTGRFEEHELSRRPCKPESHIDAKSLGALGMRLVYRLRLFRLPDSSTPKNAWDAFNAYSFRSGDLSASRDDFGWRMHTTVTGMSKQLRRQLVSTTGQKLGAIDISCCQPTIMAGKAKLNLRVDATGRERERGEERQYTISLVSLPNGGCLVPPDEELLPLDQIPLISWELLSDFQRLCCESDVYTYFVEQFQAGRCAEPYRVFDGKTGRSWLTSPRKWDRDDVKKAMIVAMFGDVASMLSNPVYHLMQLDFPDVAQWLLDEKLEPYHVDGIGKNELYKSIAQQCQRTEALVMIDGVSAKFLDEFPGEPIATIYDEIICPVERLDWVAECIAFGFAKRGIAIRPPEKYELVGGKAESMALSA